MASPPFNINQALPGDSDIVSQHPGNARTFRDIVESWLLINHDTNGNHARLDMPRVAAPGSPASGVDVMYVNTNGRLKIKHSDGTDEFVGVVPGTVSWFAAATAPNGWLAADGSIVIINSFPDLFSVIGTTYGGDGITTFGLPDLRGRTPVGVDAGAGRLSTATMSAVTVGGVGGAETKALVPGNIPSGVSVTVSSVSTTVTIPTVNVSVSGTISGSSTGSTASGSISGSASGGTVSGTPTGTISGTAAVTSDSNVQKNGNANQNLASGTNGFGWSNTPVVGTLNSTGNITASFAGTGFSGGTISSPATVTGSFSGATVSTGTVAGSFSGSGTGTGSGSGTGTGTGTTTGTNPGTAFSGMPPAIVLYPIIKT